MAAAASIGLRVCNHGNRIDGIDGCRSPTVGADGAAARRDRLHSGTTKNIGRLIVAERDGAVLTESPRGWNGARPAENIENTRPGEGPRLLRRPVMSRNSRRAQGCLRQTRESAGCKG